jgi:protein tyrosine/serine phosphatase
MRAWSLRDDQVIQALRILADRSNRPILVHCQHGADRTGVILALYRVVVQGWTKEDALREMNDGGYHHSSFFSNLDRYVANANVAALRRELAITLPAASLAGPAVLPAPPSRAPTAP